MEPSIQPPRIPQDIEAIQLAALEDYSEHYSLRLADTDLSGQVAASVVFEEARFKRVSFAATRLSRGRFVDADIEGSDFSGAAWDSARLTRVAFSNSRLIGIQLLGAELNDVRFQACNLTGGLLQGIDARHLAFDQCVLRGTSFQSSKLKGVSFRDSDLSGADFQGAQLSSVDFRGANLNQVVAGAADLQGAIIDPSQAAQVVSLLGVVVRELDDEP